MAFLGIKLFNWGKAKPAKKKEKKESYFHKMKKSRNIGYKSGYDDMAKLPNAKGAKTMARLGYGNGQKDKDRIYQIKKKYDKKSKK